VLSAQKFDVFFKNDFEFFGAVACGKFDDKAAHKRERDQWIAIEGCRIEIFTQSRYRVDKIRKKLSWIKDIYHPLVG